MAMETFGHFTFVFMNVLPLAFLVYSQDQTGFISMDCGISAGTIYSDDVTGLNYVSDESFIETGVSKSIAPGYSSGLDRQFLHVRSFPEGARNCYNVSVTKGTLYLIRANFMYGDYDGKNDPPAFDLHIGTNKWATIQLSNATVSLTEEIIHVATLSQFQVCLVNIGSGVPFISGLEFRPLLNDTYEIEEGSLVKFARFDVGSTTNKRFRYPDDVYDRIWFPYQSDKWTDISTDQTINEDDDYYFQPPSAVMSTASCPTNASKDMEIHIGAPDTTLIFYVYMYFAEIVKLEANESRKFNISVNGEDWYGPLTPHYLSATPIYSSDSTPGPYNFKLYKIGGSTRPPLVNAIEVYYVLDLQQLETNQGDVDAISLIKSNYKITRNWQGDPCAPQVYTWEGLNCSYEYSTPPTITSLNLSSSELTGQIAPDIANLKYLQILDLSNNSLTGPVPDFLSQLTSLRVLNLTGNKLTGKIPAVLFAKSETGLILSVGGNPDLCAQVSCVNNEKTKKKSIVVPVVAGVAALLVLLAVFAIIIYTIKRKKLQVPASGNEGTEIDKRQEHLESKQRRFTYNEILKMTNSFHKVIGKGGFGMVFHGWIDDVDVAVKMFSPSSVQGYKQFEAEVKLLVRVHHKALTTLVGYCDEGPHMGLIYEYMANGNLKDYLSGNNPQILTWERRLQIAMEAAQGLEYLHTGCKPPIVHRDVKSTNILLGDNFHAKLGDFGLSRTFPAEGGTHVSTIVAGTPGYLDPEYHVTNWLTEKSDVYNFGVVLLEIITGHHAIAKTQDKTHISVLVSTKLGTGDIHGIADPNLRGDFNVNSMWRAVELAMQCVSSESIGRPTMDQVVVELKECWKFEVARSKGQSASETSVELMSVNLHTKATPLAR